MIVFLKTLAVPALLLAWLNLMAWMWGKFLTIMFDVQKLHDKLNNKKEQKHDN